MTYTPTLVANNVLNRAFAEKRKISPMKLQKILYFVASEYQKATGRPLFSEWFETWEYGPVLRSVYREFRPFSRSYITRFSPNANNESLMIDERKDPTLGSILDTIWETTKDRLAVNLSEITHMEDSAWDRAFQNRQPYLESDDILNDTTYRVALGLGTND